MDSNFVASKIVGKLRQNHTARIDELRGHIDTKYNHQLSYYKDVEINALRSVDPDDPHLECYMPHTYLMSEDVEKRTQLHDGGRRYGAMTTNISECFNEVLKGAHGLPMLQWLSSLDANLLHISMIDIKKLLLIALKKTSGHTVREFNHETGVYQVVTPYNDHRGGGGNHSHEVHVFARTCGCEKWQNIKIPCSHAIKVLQQLHLNATSYIDPCYSLENAIHTYSHQFMVPKSESLSMDVRGPRWVPDPSLLRAKGCPVKSRIRNEMDGVWRKRESRNPDSDLREIQPMQRCGVCHEEGHNCRRFPNSLRASTSGSRGASTGGSATN
ncbi:uncharacterized protein LOC142625175 [Castanea sativa]|uniref:uncharacterized protein LOC142625175 n=1 Tax=Castanea sativa TaxID=21020 RepID=UPI003F64CE54